MFVLRAKNSCSFDRRIMVLRSDNKKMIQRSVTQKRSLPGSIRINSLVLAFVVLGVVLSAGFFYLYQVNDLATKGFDVREAENRIKDLKEESKKLQIKEVELRSMYTIEKQTQELNLVNSPSISYIEENGPVAMR